MIPTIATIVSLIVLVVTTFKRIKMNKFEFEHRTTGGVIQFDSYGASRAHFALKGVLRVVWWISLIVFVLELLTQ
jgi:hypothetical protein